MTEIIGSLAPVNGAISSAKRRIRHAGPRLTACNLMNDAKREPWAIRLSAQRRLAIVFAVGSAVYSIGPTVVPIANRLLVTWIAASLTYLVLYWLTILQASCERMQDLKRLLAAKDLPLGTRSPEAPVRLAPMLLTCRSTLPPAADASEDVAIRDPQAGCANCSARRSCLPRGLELEAVRQFDALVATRKSLRKGQALYRVGDPCGALYAMRVGSCKTTVLTEDGREQVCGYHLRGDVLGMDSLHEGRHRSRAVAMEQSEVCALPFARVVEMSRRVPYLQRTLHRLLACESDRNHRLMHLIRSLRAEERVAAFLLNFAHRYAQCGHPSTGFVLTMTRLDIGSYLGLTMETVSRALTHLEDEGLIQMKCHSVKLLDALALQQLVRQHGLQANRAERARG